MKLPQNNLIKSFDQKLESPFIMNPSRFEPTGPVGGWVELDRTTLGSTGDTIDVTSLDDKRYYMILGHLLDSGAIQGKFQFNSDTDSNYAYRYNNNNSGEGTSASNTVIRAYQATTANDKFGVHYLANLSGKEKLIYCLATDNTGSGVTNVPNRAEVAGKWVNTSNPISSIQMINGGAGDYAVGSEVVVLGWDPDDTHTTNFWVELKSASGTANGDVDTSTFTAKKYLWVQVHVVNAGSTSNDYVFRVGNSSIDSGNNYNVRYGNNGAGDTTRTSSTFVDLHQNGIVVGESCFTNYFIVNDSSEEKLMIGHTLDNNSGTGAGNAPMRKEIAGKWADTSNQIDVVGVHDLGASEDFDYIIKVWGSD